MKITYHKIKNWFKHSTSRRVIWRWLGWLLLLVGLGIIIYTQIYQPAPLVENSFAVLPSGEEAAVKQSQVEVKTEPKEPAGNELAGNDKAVAGNKIVIPKMGVNAEILEGGIEMLAQGVWLLPDTSTPDKGGNTVITAHRWKYKPPDPRTFYNIDKLKIGDRFDVYWQGKKYTYEVSETKVVTPEQTEILYPTKDPIITLFSCTPLYSTDYRLVVVAKLVE